MYSLGSRCYRLCTGLGKEGKVGHEEADEEEECSQERLGC